MKDSMDTAYKEHKRDSAGRIKVGLLACLVIHPAGLKLFLEGLDELELAMAYSARGLFNTLRDDKNHADTVLCKVCIFWDKIQAKKCYTVNFSIAYAEHASDSTLQRRKIQGRLYTVWKLTIIFDSRRSNDNPRPHLVTIFDDIF
jgi:hypothetical protein